MAPVELIIIIALFFCGGFVLYGIYNIRKFEQIIGGIALISLGIGLGLAISLWGINRSNCLNGSSETKSTLNVGKSTYYGHNYYDTSKSFSAKYCDEKGYTFGYIIKYTIVISVLSFVIAYFIFVNKKYKNYAILGGIGIVIILIISSTSKSNNISNKINEFIQLDKQCCINNNGKYDDTISGKITACSLIQYRGIEYSLNDRFNTNQLHDNYQQYKSCREKAYDDIIIENDIRNSGIDSNILL